MNSPIRIVLLVLVLLFPSLSAVAQDSPLAWVFSLRSASGKYLSATGTSEQLGLAPHVSGWEQWQINRNVGALVIQSFHGTVLTGLANTNQPRHTAFLNVPFRNVAPNTPDPKRAEVSNVQVMTFNGAARDEMALVFTGANGLLYALSENADGSIGVVDGYTPIVQKLNQLPASAKWKVERLNAAPMAGRQDLRLALTSTAGVSITNIHGTRLGSGQPSKQVPPTVNLVLLPGTMRPEASISADTSGHIGSATLQGIHFGQTVYISFATQGGTHFLWPGLSPVLPYGPVRVELLQRDYSVRNSPADARWDTRWQIVDPTGRFKEGDRVSLGIPIVFRSVKSGHYMAVDPKLPLPYLSPAVAKNEQWMLHATR